MRYIILTVINCHIYATLLNIIHLNPEAGHLDFPCGKHDKFSLFYGFHESTLKVKHKRCLLSSCSEPRPLLQAASLLRGSLYCPWNFAIRKNWVSSSLYVLRLLRWSIQRDNLFSLCRSLARANQTKLTR